MLLKRLVAELGELGVVGGGDRSDGLGAKLEGGGLCSCQLYRCIMSHGAYLALVVGLALGLPLLLEPVDDVLVSPSNLVRDTLEGAELPAGLEAEDTESGGDNHLLDLVLCGGHTLEKGETGQGGGTTRCLVGNHAADGLVEDTRRSAVVERTALLGVDKVALCKD
jgi:hypothetical protein